MAVLSGVIFRLIRARYVLSRKRFRGTQDHLTESDRRESFCRFVSVSQEIVFNPSVARRPNWLLHVLHICLS